MHVILSMEDAETLARLVERSIEDLRQEVRHTHESDLREDLKHREHELRRILDLLCAPAGA